jgi:hypothetical protein
VVLVFVEELSFDVCGVRTPLLEVCFELVFLGGSAAFFVRGFATTSSFEVVDPDEQAVAVRTNATTNGKDSFFSFMRLLLGAAK